MTNSNEQEEKFGQAEANGPISSSKLKEYGLKAYLPFLNVLHKYQADFTPYFDAIATGLEGGVNALTKENSSEQQKYIGRFFQEALDSIGQVKTRLQGKDLNSFVSFIEEQASKRPSVIFSASYISGLFIGRIGRHIGRSKFQGQREEKSSDINREAFGDRDFQIGEQPIH